MSASHKTRVYRVRNLPGHLDRHGAARLLAQSLQSPLEQIHVHSLANAIDPWQHATTQTATCTFESDTSFSWGTHASRPEEWSIPVAGLRDHLIIDRHFEDFTPLNDPDPALHLYDCIAISGLASHPFGSWQTHGSDKAFMWIRDALPQSLDSFRFLTYGYDTTIVNSQSIQSIPDLAARLIFSMKSNGWASPGTKRIVFLAHSLGGVLLKQVLVMLANGGVSETFMLGHMKGALFFGVPSKGMDVSHLLAMTRGQPNQALIDDLAIGSPYLLNLGKQLDGISNLRKMRFFWAYETKKSPTVEKNEVHGTWSKTGPSVILVSKDSATNGLHITQPMSTFHIDENHSDMVKLTQGDSRTRLVTQSLMDIIGLDPAAYLSSRELYIDESTETHRSELNIKKTSIEETTFQIQDKRALLGLFESTFNSILNTEVILDALRAPERDRRLGQIDPANAHTFEWIYDDDENIGFTNWLRKGEGIFWISGKPGSGKSTMMKLIHNDPRTTELMHSWGSTYKQISVAFFFHHRGDVMQKSFEGLLRGIVSQILEREPKLAVPIRQMLIEEYNNRIAAEKLGDLPSDLESAFKRLNLSYDQEVDREVRSLVECLDAKTTLRNTFARLFNRISDVQREDIESRLISNSENLLKDSDENIDRVAAELSTKIGILRLDTNMRKLVRTWLERINYPQRITRLFDKRQNNHPDFNQTKTYCLSRQRRRSEILKGIQEESWTRSSLEVALKKILKQDQQLLEITLFLDALDEYDGRARFIAEFLADVTEKKYQHTRVRICFSSRPWPVFIEKFTKFPGFKIHEHTESDIRTYCLDTVSAGTSISWPLAEMVPEIVRRARGVFLWVRLVLVDLMDATKKFAPNLEAEESSQKLWAILHSLPDQLDDYYITIVNRTPKSSRWEMYVILECVFRATRPLAFWEAELALQYSKLSEFPERLNRVEDLPKESPRRESSEISVLEEEPQRNMPLRPWRTDPTLKYLCISDYLSSDRIRTISGGLVELLPPTSVNVDFTLEFMHQTVKEFVQQPEFKHKVLGNWAKVISENGHSFLAKLHFVQMTCGNFDIACSEARKSEETTGRSLYPFLSSASDDYFIHDALNGLETLYPDRVSSSLMIDFITINRLNLCIKDAFNSQKRREYMSAGSLIAPLVYALDQGSDDQQQLLETARLIIDHGFSLGRDDIKAIFERCDPLNQSLEALVWTDVVAKSGAVSLLHSGYPRLTERLLRDNTDANTLDHAGNTSLDSILQNVISRHYTSLHIPLRSANLLVQNGAKFNATSKRDWKKFVDICGGNDVRVLQLKAWGLPCWLEGSPSSEQSEKKKRGIMALLSSRTFRRQ